MMADDANGAGGLPRSAGQPEEMSLHSSDALIDERKALSPPFSIGKSAKGRQEMQTGPSSPA
jgi:hypothetical protein